jgi:hypothetical protein
MCLNGLAGLYPNKHTCEEKSEFLPYEGQFEPIFQLVTAISHFFF